MCFGCVKIRLGIERKKQDFYHQLKATKPEFKVAKTEARQPAAATIFPPKFKLHIFFPLQANLLK